MKDQSNREESIFDAAVQLPIPADRAAYLRDACGEDAALRHRIEELLRAHDQAGAFLEPPVVTADAELASMPANAVAGHTTIVMVTEKAGDKIGRYKLLQMIGEGGCGIVYMAEQLEPVRRRVALKIIKLGMDTKTVIARFEAERQALALMDHPNIAKVFDAGATETGRPYFVMELVRGVRMTEYCDQANLPTEDRLKLFIQVCRAIQHAHQKGIIHRDIKPSNILVTLHDGVPVPKVIDFGIAKATEQRLTEKTLFTEFQTFIGTPAYVSPEQAEMSGLDIDTRSDIYSLGVLLYELLTGQTPFDPEQLIRSGLDGMRRTIRESEPLRPSTRLRTMLHADLTTTANRQQVEAPKLISRIRGDLDWIVMKCLEKDRTRRYVTTDLLAMDIERYLTQQPVFARPPSKLYLLQKMVRRNKAAFIGGAAVTAALVAGLIASTWLFFGEREARQDAVGAQQEQARLRGEAEQARLSESQQRQRAEAEQRIALRTAYNSDMNLIQLAMAANNFGRTVDLLNRHRPAEKSQISNSKTQMQPDLRQWEWRYFWNQSQSDAAFALPPQPNSIYAVAISPDGRFLVSSGMSGVLKLWDLFRRSEAAVLRERGFGSAPFAFSPKGDRLAAAINEGPRRSAVKVWTVATREITAEIPHDAQALVFSPDGMKLLLLSQDMTVRTWDFEQRQFVQQTKVQAEGFQRRVTAFSPDATRLAMGDDDGHVRVIDLASGSETSDIAAFEDAIAALAFSPGGESLAATARFTQTIIKLFSPASGAELGQLAGHASWVPGLTFTADGKRLVSSGADQTVRVWELDGHRELIALQGHLSEVNCAAVTPDGKTIVSGCKDGTLFGWDVERTERKKSFETLPTRVSSIEFTADNQRMFSVNLDGTVSLWNSGTLQEIERIAALGTGITRLLVSADGSRLFAGTRDGEIKVLDWASRLVITNLAAASGRGFGPPGRGPGPPGRGSFAGPVALVDHGRTLVGVGGGGSVRLWDTVSWELKGTWRAGEGPGFRPFANVILSPDARALVVAGGRGGTIDFRNLQNGNLETSLADQEWGASGMAFSPDGRLFATSSAEGTVNFWNISERKISEVLRGHLLSVHAVAFSPDGQRVASGSHGQEAVKLWDVVTQQEVATLAGQGFIFNLVKFSPGGKLLVAVNLQGHAHLWRAPALEEIEAAEKARTANTP
jgi:WD40 repeat protein/serine/threonine protein kinase